jgi:hypothetical protein
MLLTVLVTAQDDHPQGQRETGFGPFQQTFLEPASLRGFVLEDDHFIRLPSQQGVLGRLDRIRVAHLPRGLDAIRPKLLEHAIKSSLGFSFRLVDIAQRVAEGALLDRGDHYLQVDRVSSRLALTRVNLTQRLGANRVAGDYRQ